MTKEENTETPTISIIIPVLNVEPYLNCCLNSVLNQTYQNIEIIIIASTSNDASVEICEEYAKKDKRIKLIHSKPNGLSAARNRGIDIATGEYLSFIDSDDYVHPEFISTLYAICKEHNCDIAQCGYMDVSEIETRIITNPHKRVDIYSGHEMCYNFCKRIPKGIGNLVSWNKLYHQKLFSDLRFPEGKIHEDLAITHQVFYASEKVGLTTEILYYYRLVPTSIMNSGFSLNTLDGMKFREERASFFEERGEKELGDLWLHHCVLWYPYYLINLRYEYPELKDLRKKIRRKCYKSQYTLLMSKHISRRDKINMIYRCNFSRDKNLLERNRSKKS